MTLKENTNNSLQEGSSSKRYSTVLPSVKEAREPLPSIQTYCQSKTFIANSGVNPLVAAASALFSLNAKLANSHEYEKTTELKDSLIHEIKAFECGAYTQSYHPETILLARYALCATLDETIQHTPWGSAMNWHEDNLLYTFQGEAFGGETFFYILEKLSKKPEQHIDLLEFMYICLSLGFRGKYQQIDKHQQELDHTVDNLFQLIRKHRGDFPNLLSAPASFTPKKITTDKKTIPFWAISMITAVCLAVVYIGFNYIVEISTTPLYNKLASLNTAMEANANAQKQT